MAERVDEEIKYEYGADLGTEPVPVIDPAVGRTVTLRTFEFKIQNPETFPTDKQKVFNDHYKLVSAMLWADGLVPMEKEHPQVIIDLPKLKFLIIVAAEANSSNTFIEAPKSLTEMLSSTAPKNDPTGN